MGRAPAPAAWGNSALIFSNTRSTCEGGERIGAGGDSGRAPRARSEPTTSHAARAQARAAKWHPLPPQQVAPGRWPGPPHPPPSAKPHRMGRLEGQPDVVGALNPAPTSQYHPAVPTSGSFWYWKMAMGFLVHSAMAAMTLGLVIICARSGSPITCGGVESRNGGWKTARERKLSGRQVGRGGMGAGGVACKRGRETRGVGRAGGQGGARGSRGDVGMSRQHPPAPASTRQHPPAPASAAPTHLLDKLIWLHAQGVKLGIHLQAGRQAGRQGGERGGQQSRVGAGWAAGQAATGDALEKTARGERASRVAAAQ